MRLVGLKSHYLLRFDDTFQGGCLGFRNQQQIPMGKGFKTPFQTVFFFYLGFLVAMTEYNCLGTPKYLQTPQAALAAF